MWCQRFDFFARNGGWKRRSLKWTEGGEDHVEFVLAELVNTALNIVRRKGESASLREEKRAEAKVSRVRYETAS